MGTSELYKGKLGFEGAAKDALAFAASAVIKTFEEHGHEVFSFGARCSAGFALDLDHFSVEIRLRPQMKRGWKVQQLQGDTLDVRITSLYPDVFDHHLCEMLLAAVLRDLVIDLEAISVQWLDTPHILTRDQFLSVFDPLDVDAFETSSEAEVPQIYVEIPFIETEEDADLPALEILHAEEVEQPNPMPTRPVAHDDTFQSNDILRPRGRDVFAPVDATIEMLEHHCDEILMADQVVDVEIKSEWSFAEKTSLKQRANTWASVPLKAATGAMRFLRTNDLRYGAHLLLMMATVLYLDSAGMVRAAIALLDLPN